MAVARRSCRRAAWPRRMDDCGRERAVAALDVRVRARAFPRRGVMCEAGWGVRVWMMSDGARQKPREQLLCEVRSKRREGDKRGRE